MILPGETEAGSAAMQPCRGIAWWAHRDDDRKRGTHLPRSSQNHIGSKDPNALKIPARRAEFTLTENASFHFTLNRHMGGWTKHRLNYVVMLVKVPRRELRESNAAGREGTAALR